MKRIDYIVIAVTGFILGIALVSQFYASKGVTSLAQPENNDVLAVEIEKLAKTNSAMKVKIGELTSKYNDLYANNSPENSYEKYYQDLNAYDTINGVAESSGQGVKITITGDLSTAQIVDFINALKNIGAEAISINSQRITLTNYISSASFSSPYEILALGNSSLLQSALTRKGGIVEQIKVKNINISVDKADIITLPVGENKVYKFAKIVDK